MPSTTQPHPFRLAGLAATATAVAALAFGAFPAVGAAQSASTSPDPPPTTRPAEMPDTVPGRALVRFQPGVEAAQRDRVLDQADVTVTAPMGLSNAYEVRFDESRSPERVSAELGSEPGVKWAEPDYYGEALGGPAPDPEVDAPDADFGKQWGLENPSFPGKDIGIKQSWGITKGDVDPLVAVIDSGVYYNHQDLSSQIYSNPVESQPGKSYNGVDDDNNGYVDDHRGYDVGSGDTNANDTTPVGSAGHEHGTYVAGIIGARSNAKGITGVAPTASILPVKVFKDDGKFTSGRLADGITYADRAGAEIANVSLSVGVWTNSISDAITEADDMLIVAGAGNDDYDLDSAFREVYPCESNHSNVMCIAAHGKNGADIAWSNEGDEVDLAAPGESITSTGIGYDEYDTVKGTSVAAPYASGVAVLLWGMNGWIEDQNQHTRADSVIHYLQQSVSYEPTLVNRVYTGGRLNAYEALKMLPLREPKVLTYDPLEIDKTWFKSSAKIGLRGIGHMQVGLQVQEKGKPQTRKEYWYMKWQEAFGGEPEMKISDSVVVDKKGTTYEYRHLGHNPYGTNDLSDWRTFTTEDDPQPPEPGPGGFTNGPKPTH